MASTSDNSLHPTSNDRALSFGRSSSNNGGGSWLDRAMPSAMSAPSASEGEGQQDGMLHILWRRRWIFAGCTVLALVAAWIYLMRATAIYSSQSQVFIEQSGPRVLSDTGGGVVVRSDNYLFNECALITSTPILAGALNNPEMKGLKSLSELDNPVGYLKATVHAAVGKNNEIITVSAESQYPDDAARIVNAVVDSYVSFHAKQKRSSAAEVMRILQTELDKREKEYQVQMQALTEFRKANGTISLESDKGNIEVETLQRLSQELGQANLDTLMARTQLETLKAAMSDPAKLQQFIAALPENEQANFKSSATLREQITEQQFLLNEMLRKYGRNYAGVQLVENRVAHLQRQAASYDKQSLNALLAGVQGKYQTAADREAQLRKAFDDQRKRTLDLNSKYADYALMDAQLKRTERLCDMLDSRLKEVNVNEEAGGMNINVLEVGHPSESPDRPVRSQTLGIALVIGLMLGLGTAVGVDWMDQRMRSPEEVQARLGIPLLGAVPHIVGKQTIVERGQCVHLDPMSGAAEAYRSIRTAIYFGSGGSQFRTLLITSPEAGDGKSTVASNLAISMAQAGRRVLLIDADFRRPRQHVIFAMSQENGLAGALTGGASLDEAIRKTPVSGLDLLPAGFMPVNPAEILNSPEFAQVTGELTKKYDHVIFDSPPVMPVTDARILGAMCELTLIVLRAEKSTRRGSRQAVEGLLGVGARLIGTVVNDVPRRGSYGYYHYYYGYGQDVQVLNSNEPPVIQQPQPQIATRGQAV